MKVKRGWYRLWVICATLWIIFALIRWGAVSEFKYAISYYFDREDFAIDEAELFCPIHISLHPQEKEPIVKQDRSQLTDLRIWERDMAAQTHSDNIICNPHILLGYGGREESVDEIYQCLLKRSETREREVEAADEKKKSEQTQAVAVAEEWQIKQCIRDFKLSEPRWEAVALTFLPPTVGVILVLLVLRGFYLTFRWIWRGFH